MNQATDRYPLAQPRPGTGRWTVRDVMTTDVATAHPDTPYRRLVQTLADRSVSALPVVDADRHVLGVVSEADLLTKLEFAGGENHRTLLEGRRHRTSRVKADADTAADLMTRPAVVIAQTAPLAAAARVMEQKRVKRLPVIDSSGRLVGVVSRSDLLRVYHRTDDDLHAEIVGPVLHGLLGIAPGQLLVTVDDGTVTIGGAVHRSSTIPLVVRLIAGVPGVIDVVEHLSYHYDDRTTA